MKSPILPVTLCWICVIAATVLCMQSCKAERATWYHPALQGNLMANGHPFDQLRYTCASREYPLGTMLKVTNVTNERSVIVKVTDRHDFKTDIDLSFIAYTDIQDFDWNIEGHIEVRIEEVKE